MKAGMVLLKWDKVDFRKTNIFRGKEEQNQIELKRETDKFTFLLGDFKDPFTIVDKISRQVWKTWQQIHPTEIVKYFK